VAALKLERWKLLKVITRYEKGDLVAGFLSAGGFQIPLL
jgi:hypothetical protein